MRATMIHLTDKQREALYQRKADTGVPVAEIVRRMIDTAIATWQAEKAK